MGSRFDRKTTPLLLIAGWVAYMAIACSAADVARIKSVSAPYPSVTDEGVPCMAWTTGKGTCFEHAGFIITAAHVIRDGVDIKIETREGWKTALVVSVNYHFDVAYLRLEKPAKLTRIEGNGLFASANGMPIKCFACVAGHFPGFDHGGSGGPLYRDGRLEGIALTLGEKDSSFVQFCPASVIDSLLPKE